MSLALSNVDDYLGPSSTRFFGSGYRKTTPALRNLSVRHSLDGTSMIEARGSLEIGDLWSVKGTSRQVPHLGTTDAIVLALEATESLLASKYSKGFLSSVYVTEVSISAGRSAIEDNLSDFPVQATLNSKGANQGRTIEVQIGPMRANVSVHRPLSVPGSADLQTADPDMLVGDAGRRVYGSLYRHRQTTIRDIQLNRLDTQASGLLDVDMLVPPAGHIGLEADYQPGLSMLESFVATLQMGQILLYELDDISRAESSTLWMRRTTIKAFGPPPSLGESLELKVRLDRARILPKNKENWRCAEIVGMIGDRVEVTCDVTHKLP